MFLRSSRTGVDQQVDRLRTVPGRLVGEIADIFEREAELVEQTRPAREELRLEWQAWSEANDKAFLDAMVEHDRLAFPTFDVHHQEARARRGLK